MAMLTVGRSPTTRRSGKDAGMIPLFRNPWLRWTLTWFGLVLAAASGTPGTPLHQLSASAFLWGGAGPGLAALLPQEIPTAETEPSAGLSQKQKRDILKANFEKMKRDADELADLAKSLQEDLNKSNANVLSLGIVEKAEKIEKLAKKIKSTAKGF